MLLAVAALLALVPQDPPFDVDAYRKLFDELGRAVDQPTPEARRAAADDLVARKLASLSEWAGVCQSFRPLKGGYLEPGPSRQTVELQVLDQVVKTELFLFVPKSYDVNVPAPLLLWGHGAGGTGAREHLLWEKVAEQVGMLVLAIDAIDAEPGYHFSPGERAAALSALRWARRRANVDENAIFVGGWSQGGHQAWDLALRHPDLFAGVLPVVGGPRMKLGPENNLRYLENVAHLPIRDLQGSQDDPKLLHNLHMAFARLKKLGSKDAQLTEFADRGHDADLSAVDWPAFFALRRRAIPPRAVRIAADPAETRAFWLEADKWSQRATPDSVPEVAAGFDTMSETAQREHTLDRFADCTARIAVENKGGGKFVADGKLITAFSLLLQSSQFGKDGLVEIKLGNKTVKKKGVPDLTVMLRNFVERFDRTFFPVARVSLP